MEPLELKTLPFMHHIYGIAQNMKKIPLPLTANRGLFHFVKNSPKTGVVGLIQDLCTTIKL